jgi:Tol biopolymer transport system component
LPESSDFRKENRVNRILLPALVLGLQWMSACLTWADNSSKPLEIDPLLKPTMPGDRTPAKPETPKDEIRKLDGKLLGPGQRSSWSPDGKKIVFGCSGNDNGILVYDVAANKTSTFTPTGKDPAWAGKEGRWIAYVTGSGANEAIWAAEFPDGKPVRQASGTLPSWSGDGKTLFFHAFDKNQLMSSEVANGGFAPPRARIAMSYRYPAISPDGKRAAYKRNDELVIQQIDDGKVAKRFVLPKGVGLLGGWSPDSREFGFGGWNADDPMPCIVLDVATGQARQLASRALTFPAWSPDGTKITFDLRLRTGTRIWMVDAAVVKKLPTFKMETRE